MLGADNLVQTMCPGADDLVQIRYPDDFVQIRWFCPLQISSPASSDFTVASSPTSPASPQMPPLGHYRGAILVFISLIILYIHCIFSLLHQDCCIHIKHPGFPHQRDHWQGPGYPFARSLFSFHLCCLRPAVHLVKSGHFGNVKIIMDRYWWQIHLIGSLLNCCNYSVEKKPHKITFKSCFAF